MVNQSVYWVGLTGVTINHALDSDWLSSVMAIFTAPPVRMIIIQMALTLC